MKRFIIHVPASIALTIEAETEAEITADAVFAEIGKYHTLKHGQDFDVHDFQILDEEDI